MKIQGKRWDEMPREMKKRVRNQLCHTDCDECTDLNANLVWFELPQPVLVEGLEFFSPEDRNANEGKGTMTHGVIIDPKELTNGAQTYPEAFLALLDDGRAALRHHVHGSSSGRMGHSVT